MEACVESLVKGGERVEVIVIDDGSKDNTGAIADALAEKYPSIVRVIHQPNGGHGEGINAGLREAKGRFFKVVDSDDKVGECFPRFLDALEGGAYNADLVVTNYVYTYSDERKDQCIHYRRTFDADVLMDWEDTRPFGLKQYVTLHSSTFRTEVMRKSGMNLPKHVSYEDNVMICNVLPYTEKVYYVDCDLYLYTIGREGQSMSDEAMTKKYKHQILAASLSFESCHLDDIKQKSKRLYDLMCHEFFMLFGGACVFARKSKTVDGYNDLVEMWNRAYAFDKKYAQKFRKRTILRFANIKGVGGQRLIRVAYKFAHHLVKFN